jgi:hypothetical protein
MRIMAHDCKNIVTDGKIYSPSHLAGLGAGVTEAVMVVGPMEVVKIRLQAQVHSMTDPLDVPKYRNAAHALFVILREEGPKTLYRGVGLTALRQATNQGERAAIMTRAVAMALTPVRVPHDSRQLHRLHRAEEAIAKVATAIP